MAVAAAAAAAAAVARSPVPAARKRRMKRTSRRKRRSRAEEMRGGTGSSGWARPTEDSGSKGDQRVTRCNSFLSNHEQTLVKLQENKMVG